jgi:hypothetical protein
MPAEAGKMPFSARARKPVIRDRHGAPTQQACAEGHTE